MDTSLALWTLVSDVSYGQYLLETFIWGDGQFLNKPGHLCGVGYGQGESIHGGIVGGVTVNGLVIQFLRTLANSLT